MSFRTLYTKEPAFIKVETNDDFYLLKKHGISEVYETKELNYFKSIVTL